LSKGQSLGKKVHANSRLLACQYSLSLVLVGMSKPLGNLLISSFN